MCIAVAGKVPKTLGCDSFDLTRGSESVIVETLVAESEIGKTLVSESAIGKTLDSESAMDENLVDEPAIDENAVVESAIDENPVVEPAKNSIDETLVPEQSIDGTLVVQTVIDQTLGEDVILGEDIETSCEQGSDESSPSSSLKYSPEDAFSDDQSYYHGAGPREGLYDMDDREMDFRCMYGMPPHMPHMRGYPFGPRYDPRHMLNLRDGWSPWDRRPCMMGEKKKKRNKPDLTDDDHPPIVGAGLCNLGKTLVFDEPLAAESAMGKIQASESVINENQVAEPEIGETLVPEKAIEETPVSVQSIDGTLAVGSVIDQTIGEDHIMDEDVETSCEQGSDESSHSSSLNYSPEDAFADAQSYYHGAGPLEGLDDVDDRKMDFRCIYGMPPHMWRHMSHMRGYPFGPRYDPRRMLHLHDGWSPWERRPWTMGEKKKKRNNQEWNGLPWPQPDLVDDDPPMVGAGLCNLGNTCFLNAILQCFTHTVPLVEGLRSYNHPKQCERDSEGFCVFCALHKHIELAITSIGKSISPLKLVENLNYLSSDFRRYQQEDAHELLQCLLDKLDQCCNWSETGDGDESLVDRLFGGRLVSKLKCCNCGHCSDTFESLIDFSLEIENVSSLPSALESFTKLEKIEDEEPQFTCESCDEKVAVEKQLMVDHAPSVAAFHLKRFKNDGSRVEKIDKHVEFPLELDLKPYTSGDQDENADLSYKLYAIVVHAGFSPTSGHYFCFVRSAPDTWYRLDDSRVTKVSESHVLSRDAYILFYAKNGTPWFSTFLETEKAHLDSSVSTSSPKSVLETANQSSESSPTRETIVIREVCKEDQMEAENDLNLEKNSSLSPSRGDTLFVSNSSPNSVLGETDHNSELSPIVESNINTVGNEENRRDDVEISRSSSNYCRYKDEVNEANDDFDSARKSVSDNLDHISESPSSVETTSSSDVNKENCGDAMETCNVVHDAKVDCITETSLFGGNSSSRDGEFTKVANLDSSTSRGSIIPVGISGLSFDDCTLKDRVGAAKDGFGGGKLYPSTLRRRIDGKRAVVNHSTFSEKRCAIPRDHLMTEREVPCKRQSSNNRLKEEAYKEVKGRLCSRRRSKLMVAVNDSRDGCSGIKRRKINEPNLVSQRRVVAPRRFR